MPAFNNFYVLKSIKDEVQQGKKNNRVCKFIERVTSGYFFKRKIKLKAINNDNPKI